MDRLSQLPDSVIFHIFWFMSMDDVVKTTILSKRWRNLWTITPFLNFDVTIRRSDTNETLRNCIHRALLRWDGVRILKFRVVMYHEDEDEVERRPIVGDIDLWAHFAKKYEVEELYLHTMLDDFIDWRGDYDRTYVFWVPQCLYSCSSLKKLSIENFYFRISGNVEWNQLKCLKIIDGFGVDGHVMNQILSGSPRLEVLILSFVERCENLCIRSSSLKVLSIYKYLYERDDLSLYTELRIWAPNLETLEIKGIPYRKCLLVDVSSLTHVTLGCSGLHFLDQNYCDLSGIDGFSSTDHFLEDLFSQILPSIQHVEHVTLQSCCVKVLGVMTERCMNSSSPNVKSLQLGYLLVGYRQFVGIVEIFPQLKKLVFNVRKWDTYHDKRDEINFHAKTYADLEANLPKSFVLQLKIVEVTRFKGQSIFPFLQFLLKYASKLEKIVVRAKGVMPPSGPTNHLLLASQKLLTVPRSSPTVQFVFCDY